MRPLQRPRGVKGSVGRRVVQGSELQSGDKGLLFIGCRLSQRSEDSSPELLVFKSRALWPPYF